MSNRAIRARNKRVANRGLAPWSEFERRPGDPDFYQESADSWLRGQEEMMSDIGDRLSGFDYVNPQSAVMQRMAGQISSDYGADFDETVRNMIRAANQRDQGTVLSNAVHYGVPAAAADERMGISALNMSGYIDPRPLNAGTVHATDLQAELNGRDLNIDSQKLVNQNNIISIGALQNVESAVPLYRTLEEADAKSVLEALQDLQAASRRMSDGRLTAQGMDVSGAENKLFQSSTSRFNPNPSAFYQQNEPLFRKDALLVSDHSDYRAERPELRAGSFDPRKPQSFDIVDLEALRDSLGSMSLTDLERAGGSIATHRVSENRRHFEDDVRQRRHRLSDVSLQLPSSILRGSSGQLAPISPDALQYLVQ